MTTTHQAAENRYISFAPSPEGEKPGQTLKFSQSSKSVKRNGAAAGKSQGKAGLAAYGQTPRPANGSFTPLQSQPQGRKM